MSDHAVFAFVGAFTEKWPCNIIRWPINYQN